MISEVMAVLSDMMVMVVLSGMVVMTVAIGINTVVAVLVAVNVCGSSWG